MNSIYPPTKDQAAELLRGYEITGNYARRPGDQVSWPTFVITGFAPDDPTYTKELAVADLCFVWGNVSMGYKPPDYFGYGLVSVGKKFNVPTNGKALSDLANSLLKELNNTANCK